MKLYSNAYGYAIYTLHYYEDKYFISLFAHFNHKEKYIITALIPNYKNFNDKIFEMYFLREQF